MLHDERGYRLSPAFDLVPDVGERKEHTLSFKFDFHPPTKRDFLELGVSWGVNGADQIIADVVRALAAFPSVARECQVPNDNINEVSADIAARCAKISGGKNPFEI